MSIRDRNSDDVLAAQSAGVQAGEAQDTQAADARDVDTQTADAQSARAARAAARNEAIYKARNTAAEEAEQNPDKKTRKPMAPPGMTQGEKARDFSGTMRKMLNFISQFKALILLVFIFAIGSCAFNIVGPKVLSNATTALFEGAVAKINGTGAIDFELIGGILLTTLALYLLSALCSWVQSWTMTYVSQKACYDLRRAIVEKIDRMPFGYFDNSSTGDTLSRITNDVDTLGQSLNQGVTQLVTSFVTVIGVLFMMFYINWTLALITIIMVPVALILTMLIVKRSQKHFYAQQTLLGQVNAQAEETFSGHVVVKAFSKEDETVRIYNETNDRLYEAGWKSQFLSGLMPPVMNFVSNLGYVAVAITGAAFAVKGIITVGDIQAFIQYVKNFTQPITQLAQVSNVLQQMAAAAERIFEFLEQPEESEAALELLQGEDEDDQARAQTRTQARTQARAQAQTLTLDQIHLSVDFDHVRFGYDSKTPIIKDFSAHVEEGQTVAIVGPTGAGKTTMVKLLMRFYDPQSGSIKIGGHDLREFSRDEIRSLFAMVLQDTWLFKGTIRENIAYGRLDATDEEIEEAANKACAHHFITTLPGGYDFEMNEDASNISAGQRQLLTIARAFLADRRMLILDEATSSVDTRTEERIQRAMDNLMEGRTSFVIAHRLSTIRSANLILVMNDGDIVEQGTHGELLSAGGFYAELYNSQFAENEK